MAAEFYATLRCSCLRYPQWFCNRCFRRIFGPSAPICTAHEPEYVYLGLSACLYCRECIITNNEDDAAAPPSAGPRTPSPPLLPQSQLSPDPLQLLSPLRSRQSSTKSSPPPAYSPPPPYQSPPPYSPRRVPRTPQILPPEAESPHSPPEFYVSKVKRSKTF